MIREEAKYRGTKVYSQVYGRLQEVAASGSVVTYGDIAEMMGLHRQGHNMGTETGRLVGEISEDEHRNGRPMLRTPNKTRLRAPSPAKLAQFLPPRTATRAILLGTLSAIVVRANGGPGKGFFTLARSLGKLQSDSIEEERRFWEEEKAAVYATWQQNPEPERLEQGSEE